MTIRVTSRIAKHGLFASIGSTAALLLAAPSLAGVGVDTSALNEAVTAEGVHTHLEVFQQIADNSNGNREASTEGYFASVDYVARAMTLAGYSVSVQLFPYIVFENSTPPEFQQIAPVAVTYEFNEEGFSTADYSGAGETTAIAQPVDVTVPAAADANTSTSGCEESDFAGFTAGNIALVQRGTCSFYQKAANAEAAGAMGVIIFNEGQEGRTDAFGATLGEEAGVGIPVISVSYVLGTEFVETETTVRLMVDAVTEERVTGNILADTPIGNPAKTVVVGAHLDSVAKGAGINDNGSGSAMMLEIALQMSNLGLLDSEETGIRNRVRFAWWGAEEAGLVGSTHYVYSLPDAQFEEIAANLNFDMVGSPNYVRFVYDGDGSASGDEGGPEGSAFIEWMLNDYFMEQGLATAPTAFDGRSDYGPFIENGIPAGGLFTGAEGLKTEEEAGIFGGIAGEAYDACYHDTCDSLENINLQGLDEMSDAAAYAVNVLAVNDLPISNAKLVGRARSVANAGIDLEYQGDRQRK